MRMTLLNPDCMVQLIRAAALDRYREAPLPATNTEREVLTLVWRLMYVLGHDWGAGTDVALATFLSFFLPGGHDRYPRVSMMRLREYEHPRSIFVTSRYLFSWVCSCSVTQRGCIARGVYFLEAHAFGLSPFGA